MATPIFRQAALDRLSSPEQLDALMQVTPPRTWLALSAVGVLLGAAVIWAFAGTIPTRVEAQGVLIKTGGVFDVFSNGTGPIAELLVREGDTVKQGQVVARIAQPELDTQIQNARAQLGELRGEHQQLATFAKQELSLLSSSQELQRAALLDTVRFAEERLKSLTEQVANEEALLERGLITKQTVLATRQAFFTTSDQLERARNDLQQLKMTDATTRTQKQQELLRNELRVNEVGRQITFLEEQRQLAADVISPYAGRVLEVQVSRGDLVTRGRAMFSLQLEATAGEQLEAVIYVPAKDGKHVVPGMEAQISPLSAPREEFGFLVGKVTYVSEFPATRPGMMRVLANDVVVQSLSSEGAPFAAYATLAVNPDRPGTYRWSSPKGETLKVGSGTPCIVTITVREQRPIDLVIPILREKVGLD